MKKRGSVTVFLALMLSVISAFIIMLATSVRGYVSKAESASAVDIAIRSCFAEYNRELFRRFHILLIDSSYKCADNGIDRIKGHFTAYLENSMVAGELQYAEVSSSGNSFGENADYMYDMAVSYAKEETGTDSRLSGHDDDAFFLTYLLNVCGNRDSPAENAFRTGETEFILYGFEDDHENIRMAITEFEEGGYADYEGFLARKLEGEGSLLLRRRFAELVTEYMRANGSPGFSIDECYHRLEFLAHIRSTAAGEYDITREYAYENTEM